MVAIQGLATLKLFAPEIIEIGVAWPLTCSIARTLCSALRMNHTNNRQIPGVCEHVSVLLAGHGCVSSHRKC
jgi:hypothetical protein